MTDDQVLEMLAHVPTPLLWTALRRRGQRPTDWHPMQSGNLELSPHGPLVSWRGVKTALSPTEFRALQALVELGGTAPSVWWAKRARPQVGPKQAQACLRYDIMMLRRKLPGLIQNRHAYGYWLDTGDRVEEASHAGANT